MHEKIRWSRVLTEGLVIVGSILLAFAIQAWWDWRRERVLEVAALERLETEFTQMDSVLVAWRANHSVMVNECDLLLSQVGPGGSVSLSTDSIASLGGALRIRWTINPSYSVLAALQSSGQFAAIQDLDLLIQLALFRAVMDDLQEDEVSTANVQANLVLLYLTKNVAIRATPVRGSVYSPGSRSAFPTGFPQVLGSREFESLIT